MPGITGVELGPKSCVLVRASRRGSAARTSVAGARVVTSGEWSDDFGTLAGVLRDARRANRLPHRARVVVWDLPQRPAASRVREVEAFVAAGFDVDDVLSPAQALAQIVRGRTPAREGEAVATLALNSEGMTVAIVSGDSILVSRTIAWPLGKPFSRARNEWLERYLIVSQLAPHLLHLIDLVRALYGVRVTSATACGNLPDLRSIMMLLIDEIDLEVETLDWIDLSAAGERWGEAAAALQLASAAAASGETPIDPMRVSVRADASPRAQLTRRASQALAAAAALVLSVAWSALEVSGTSAVTPAFPAGIEILTAIPPVPDFPTEATIGHLPMPSASRAAISGEAPTHGASPAPELAPLPEVSGVMIAGPRRLAIVGGAVVELGDRVDGRTILRIERESVVFQEPSGREISVPIGKREKDKVQSKGTPEGPQP